MPLITKLVINLKNVATCNSTEAYTIKTKVICACNCNSN